MVQEIRAGRISWLGVKLREKRRKEEEERDDTYLSQRVRLVKPVVALRYVKVLSEGMLIDVEDE